MTQRPEPYEAYNSDRVFTALEALEADAAARGVSMAGLALAWLLALDEVTAVIVGPGRAEPSRRLRSRDARSLSHPPNATDLTEVFSMSVLVLSEHDVRELLDMESCVTAMEDILARLARGELHNPLRSLMLPARAGRRWG